MVIGFSEVKQIWPRRLRATVTRGLHSARPGGRVWPFSWISWKSFWSPSKMHSRASCLRARARRSWPYDQRDARRTYAYTSRTGRLTTGAHTRRGDTWLSSGVSHAIRRTRLTDARGTLLTRLLRFEYCFFHIFLTLYKLWSVLLSLQISENTWTSRVYNVAYRTEKLPARNA